MKERDIKRVNEKHKGIDSETGTQNAEKRSNIETMKKIDREPARHRYREMERQRGNLFINCRNSIFFYKSKIFESVLLNW